MLMGSESLVNWSLLHGFRELGNGISLVHGIRV